MRCNIMWLPLALRWILIKCCQIAAYIVILRYRWQRVDYDEQIDAICLVSQCTGYVVGSSEHFLQRFSIERSRTTFWCSSSKDYSDAWSSAKASDLSTPPVVTSHNEWTRNWKYMLLGLGYWNVTLNWSLPGSPIMIASPKFGVSQLGGLCVNTRNVWRPNSPVTGEFPAQRPVTRSFDVFFDLRLNKRLSEQSRGWWFETPSRPLWRHCNANYAEDKKLCTKLVISCKSSTECLWHPFYQKCPVRHKIYGHIQKCLVQHTNVRFGTKMSGFTLKDLPAGIGCPVPDIGNIYLVWNDWCMGYCF